MAQPLDANSVRPVSVFVWRDIVLLRDDGRGIPADYTSILTLGREVANQYPNGFGVLIVVPHNAVPPSDAARAAIHAALVQLRSNIRCMCWLIEGSGFQAAMARAVLTSMRFLSRDPYTRHVSVDLQHALTWMLSQLTSGPARLEEVPTAAQFVRSSIAGTATSGTHRRTLL